MKTYVNKGKIDKFVVRLFLKHTITATSYHDFTTFQYMVVSLIQMQMLFVAGYANANTTPQSRWVTCQ